MILKGKLVNRTHWVLFWICLLLLRPVPAIAQDAPSLYLPLILKGNTAAGPTIGSITTNLTDYLNGQVPRYQKFELTFDVKTVAQNLQFPYDPAPPPGLEPGLGITVEALFSPDNWQTVYTQPAFYYQLFEHEVKDGQDWIYPTANFAWKVRFAPDQAGSWQYKLLAQDASGLTETAPQTFTVVTSENKGFVRVSSKDPRYFEFDSGDLFLGLGYNLTFGEISWDNPVTKNEPRFQQLQAYDLQLFRTWLSQWGIFTSAWGPWNSPLPEKHALIIPDPGLSMDQAFPGSEVAMELTWNTNPGMFLGFMKRAPAVKPNTTYHLSIRYLIPQELQGPRIEGHPYGFVAKTGGWLAGPEPWPDNIYGFVDPGTGTIVSDYAFQSPANEQGQPQWSILEGEITTKNETFLPLFYLVLENIVAGTPANGGGNKVYIDRVEIREALGNGQYGPNIVTKPWMAQHFYFEQRHSYAFDKVLELASQYDIYFKLVVMEKNVWDLNVIDYEGNHIKDPLCWDDDSNNNPANCPAGVWWFYGNGRQMTKVRWLQQAWWRYLQARWGYSPHIHSWELVNEGDPANQMHYALADQFAKYMHQFKPNDHLVTTSFWHSFPVDQFWANSEYPNLDYADLHHYDPVTDVAENSQWFSMQFGAKQPQGANKPLIRGETGYSDEILQDTAGVWLHNYIWAGLNPGGMYEQYWYAKEHIVQADQANDLRYHYQPYKNFMDGIFLNNGTYQDAQALVSSDSLRAWGQKDLSRGCAHLWIQNKNHTWKNIVDDTPIPPASGIVQIAGFQPNGSYTVQWWDTYQTDKTQQVFKTDTVMAETDGSISISLTDLATDVALKVGVVNQCSP